MGRIAMPATLHAPSSVSAPIAEISADKIKIISVGIQIKSNPMVAFRSSLAPKSPTVSKIVSIRSIPKRIHA